MAEKLSVSKETPKIHLPLKDLVGVKPSKKEPAIARKWTKKYGSKTVKKVKRRKK